jgi:hypothetical protein
MWAASYCCSNRGQGCERQMGYLHGEAVIHTIASTGTKQLHDALGRVAASNAAKLR